MSGNRYSPYQIHPPRFFNQDDTIDLNSEDDIVLNLNSLDPKSSASVLNSENNINLNLNTLNSEKEIEVMSTPNVSDIFNSLRIPDAVKDLPSFDGNPRTLFEFLDNAEEILSLIPDADGTSYGKLILRAIRNKIIGQANEVLNMYGTSLKWEEIKYNLITHYADKRNESSLIRDLHRIHQLRSETVEQFYAKIIEIFSCLMNNLKVNEKDLNVINSKKVLYEELCLNTFLTGLKDPLGSTIRAMRPKKLNEALKYCLEESNCYYMKNSYNFNLNQRNMSKGSPYYNSDISYPISSNEKNFTMTNSQINNPFSTNTNPFSNNPFSNNPFLRKNSEINLPKPEPMETSSKNVNIRSNRNYSRPSNFSGGANQQNHKTFPSSNNSNRFQSRTFTNSSRNNFRPLTSPNNLPKYIVEELHNVESDETGNLQNHDQNEISYENSNNYYQNLDEFLDEGRNIDSNQNFC